ncbi:MAG: extensin family protein [Alphaproteobacteria bacterium]|nr:MAG: extensin family protein [Alphaproteobacteria bacterium]
MVRFLALLLLLLAGAGALAVYRGLIPSHYNPFTPLDVTAPPNLVTRYKLYNLSRNPAACLATLQNTTAVFTPLEDKPDARCPLLNIVRVNRAGVPFNSSFMATCPLAVAWQVFFHNTLQQAAQTHFGQNIKEVRHIGSYACRNVYNRAQGRLSQHATANALDLTGFVLEDGTLISIEEDWASTTHPARAAFLKDLHSGACRSFNVVLGPNYNAAHKNHFHLDMGTYHMCR